MAVSYKAQHTLAIRFNNPNSRYLSKRKRNICPYKDLYTNIHKQNWKLKF